MAAVGHVSVFCGFARSFACLFLCFHAVSLFVLSGKSSAYSSISISHIPPLFAEAICAQYGRYGDGSYERLNL